LLSLQSTLFMNVLASTPPESSADISLFTAISLIIAISGSTYGAIVGVRSFFYSNIKEKSKKAAEEAKRIISSGTEGLEQPEATKAQNAISINEKIKKWYWRWQLFSFIPIIMFTIVSYLAAINVCISCWTGQQLPTAPFALYKWILVIMVVSNIICICVTTVAGGCIVSFYKKFKNNYNEAIWGEVPEEIAFE